MSFKTQVEKISRELKTNMWKMAPYARDMKPGKREERLNELYDDASAKMGEVVETEKKRVAVIKQEKLDKASNRIDRPASPAEMEAYRMNLEELQLELDLAEDAGALREIIQQTMDRPHTPHEERLLEKAVKDTYKNNSNTFEQADLLHEIRNYAEQKLADDENYQNLGAHLDDYSFTTTLRQDGDAPAEYTEDDRLVTLSRQDVQERFNQMLK